MLKYDFKYFESVVLFMESIVISTSFDAFFILSRVFSLKDWHHYFFVEINEILNNPGVSVLFDQTFKRFVDSIYNCILIKRESGGLSTSLTWVAI